MKEEEERWKVNVNGCSCVTNLAGLLVYLLVNIGRHREKVVCLDQEDTFSVCLNLSYFNMKTRKTDSFHSTKRDVTNVTSCVKSVGNMGCIIIYS